MRIFSGIKLPVFLVALIVVTAITVKADTVLYTDGPINGTYGSHLISFPYQVEDSFALSSASALTSISFGNWIYSFDTALTVDWAIVGSEGSQAPVCAACSGTGTLTARTSSINGVWKVVDESFLLPASNLPAGTYWLELQNEITAHGFPASWDMNGGPSMVWQIDNHDVSGSHCTAAYPLPAGACSNSFTIYGTPNTVISSTTPEPSSLALFGSGAVLIVTQVRRRRVCAARVQLQS